MGWDSFKGTVADVCKEDLEPVKYMDGTVSEFIAHAYIANGYNTGTLWTVRSHNGVRSILCTLIELRGGWVSTKTMGTEEHPYYYDCPRKFLDMVPVDQARDHAWRERVLAKSA